MEKWKSVRMSVTDVASGKHIRLQNAFETLFLALLAPKDAAMFGNREIENDYTYYFSPGSSAFFTSVLASYSARDCEQPNRASVALLVGHADSVKRLLNS